jgi:hypothetical protein
MSTKKFAFWDDNFDGSTGWGQRAAPTQSPSAAAGKGENE